MTKEKVYFGEKKLIEAMMELIIKIETICK